MRCDEHSYSADLLSPFFSSEEKSVASCQNPGRPHWRLAQMGRRVVVGGPQMSPASVVDVIHQQRPTTEDGWQSSMSMINH
jgi:hypothetical protein